MSAHADEDSDDALEPFEAALRRLRPAAAPPELRERLLASPQAPAPPAPARPTQRLPWISLSMAAALLVSLTVALVAPMTAPTAAPPAVASAPGPSPASAAASGKNEPDRELLARLRQLEGLQQLQRARASEGTDEAIRKLLSRSASPDDGELDLLRRLELAQEMMQVRRSQTAPASVLELVGQADLVLLGRWRAARPGEWSFEIEDRLKGAAPSGVLSISKHLLEGSADAAFALLLDHVRDADDRGALRLQTQLALAKVSRHQLGLGAGDPRPVGEAQARRLLREAAGASAAMLTAALPPARRAAALATLRDQGSLRELTQLLSHKREPVRLAAARALIRDGRPSALTALRPAAAATASMRAAALEALRHPSASLDPRAARDLLRALGAQQAAERWADRFPLQLRELQRLRRIR